MTIEKIEEAKSRLEALEDKRDNLDWDSIDDMEAKFDEHINECYQDVFDALPSWANTLTPAEVMREQDPIQYRCEFTDWLDGEDITETQEYKDIEEEIEEVEEEIEALEAELDEN